VKTYTVKIDPHVAPPSSVLSLAHDDSGNFYYAVQTKKCIFYDESTDTHKTNT